MWNSATIMMIVEGTFATIYMTLVSTLMAYVIGLPAGVALVVTGKEGLKPNKAVNRILDVLVNVISRPVLPCSADSLSPSEPSLDIPPWPAP